MTEKTLDTAFARLDAGLSAINNPRMRGVVGGDVLPFSRIGESPEPLASEEQEQPAPQENQENQEPTLEANEEEENPNRTPVDPAKLEAALMLIEAGQPITQVAEKTGISRSTLNRAMKKRREDRS